MLTLAALVVSCGAICVSVTNNNNVINNIIEGGYKHNIFIVQLLNLALGVSFLAIYLDGISSDFDVCIIIRFSFP